MRAIAVAVLAPAAATVVALTLPHAGAPTAESCYFLAVVVAAAIGGLWGGLGAAVLSFLGLNFFFVPPKHTFEVRGVEGVVALAVFLAAALLVGGLLARAIRERARAEEREHQARTLNQISTLLGSPGTLERTLEQVAALLLRLLGLSSCRIATADVDVGVRSDAGDPRGGGPVASFELSPADTNVGRLTVERPRDEPGFGAGERTLLHAVAAQLALVFEAERLDRTVKQARLEAEANRLRAALFSSVTHDLRTPLASIKAAVTGLQDAGAVFEPEQRSELLQTILEETDRLNRMVGNLLDLARLRASALEPQLQLTDVDEVLGQVLHRLAGLLAPFQVVVKVREDLPPVTADPLQMDQVLTNVLENAARFSPPGTEIVVSARRSQSRVRVSVADHGPGIPTEERERVFEEFYRRDAGSGRGGTGLGLAISRAVITAHGGRIWAEGVPGGGTAIVFELPVAPDVPVGPAPGAVDGGNGNGRGNGRREGSVDGPGGLGGSEG
jgi:two-component system sensor histidine kinase KdpD